MRLQIAQFVLDKMGRTTDVVPGHGAALARIPRAEYLGTVVDIGASTGVWSESVMPYFPGAHYLLVEAQKLHEADLKHFVAAHPNAQYVLKAAGEKAGTIFFDDAEAFGGEAMNERIREGLTEVPVCRIDDEIASRGLPGPYLLKFDVHGFEMPILRGAERTLQNTSLLVMECYNFEIAPESLLFHDMCRHLHDLGFRVATCRSFRGVPLTGCWQWIFSLCGLIDRIPKRLTNDRPPFFCRHTGTEWRKVSFRNLASIDSAELLEWTHYVVDGGSPTEPSNWCRSPWKESRGGD